MKTLIDENPQRAFGNLLGEAGGLSRTTAASQEPRNRIQIYKIVKDWIGRKEKVSIPTWNAEIKSLLRSYSQDFELAVYGQ